MQPYDVAARWDMAKEMGTKDAKREPLRSHFRQEPGLLGAFQALLGPGGESRAMPDRPSSVVSLGIEGNGLDGWPTALESLRIRALAADNGHLFRPICPIEKQYLVSNSSMGSLFHLAPKYNTTLGLSA